LLPVIVVEGVNQKPRDNLPGVAEILGVDTTPTEFEMSVIKTSDPASRGIRFQIQPGGRVNLQGVNLKFSIEPA
jgi:hypothetical protein